jgi:tetratricopeptide (TPR) repeat protein
MSHRAVSNRLLVLLLALGLGPASVSAQSVHVEALRLWMQDTENAAKYVEKGDFARAEERLNHAIKEIRPYLPDTRRIMARSYGELAKVLYLQKRYADAEPLARWALSVRESDKKANPDAVFQSVYTLALIQSARHEHREAEELLKRALDLQEKNLGRDHVNSRLLMSQLAVVYIADGKLSEAEPLYQRSIAIHERTTPDENLELAETADQYALLLRRMKRVEEADRWQARAAKIRDTVATKTARAKADRAANQFKGFK